MSFEVEERLAAVFREAYQNVVDHVDISDSDDLPPLVRLPLERRDSRRARPLLAVLVSIVVLVAAFGALYSLRLVSPVADTEPPAPFYPVIPDIESVLGPRARTTDIGIAHSGGLEGVEMVAWADDDASGYAVAVVYLVAPTSEADLATAYPWLDGGAEDLDLGPAIGGSLIMPTSSSPGAVSWRDNAGQYLLAGYGLNMSGLVEQARVLVAGGALPAAWPGGLERVYEGPGIIQPPGIEASLVSYESADRERSVEVMSMHEYSDIELAALLTSPASYRIRLGDGEGVATPYPGGGGILVWSGENGRSISLAASDLTVDELQDLAFRLVEGEVPFINADVVRAFGLIPAGDVYVIGEGSDWSMRAQAVAGGKGDGVCYWTLVNGRVAQETVTCEFPAKNPEGAHLGPAARVAAGTLYLGSAPSGVTEAEVLLDSGTALTVPSVSIPGHDELGFFALVVPSGAHAETFTLHDLDGAQVFTAPLE